MPSNVVPVEFESITITSISNGRGRNVFKTFSTLCMKGSNFLFRVVNFVCVCVNAN